MCDECEHGDVCKVLGIAENLAKGAKRPVCHTPKKAPVTILGVLRSWDQAPHITRTIQPSAAPPAEATL